jgi:hypothetical protein
MRLLSGCGYPLDYRQPVFALAFMQADIGSEILQLREWEQCLTWGKPAIHVGIRV